jgi:hypothetical protein
MNFTYPLFLFSLFTLAVPIIIHLFNFRTYKTIYFSNVAFLKNLKQETASKSKIKHFLVLVSRLLALAALVFAFSQPYVPSKDSGKIYKDNLVGIYVDNSFSAEADSKYGKLIDVAKKKAFLTADAYPRGTEFVFLSNEFKALHQRPVGKEQFREFVNATETEPEVRKISEVIERFKNTVAEFSKSQNHILYLISDFQKSTADLQNLKDDSLLKTVLVPLEAEASNNLSVDSVWFENPDRKLNAPDEIFVSVSNKSNESFQNIPLKLYLNDTLKVPGSFNIAPHESHPEKLVFTNNKAGFVRGRVEIVDFPVTFDNSFYFNFEIAENKKVLIVGNSDKNPFIDELFAGNPYFIVEHRTENNIRNSELSKSDVLILDGQRTVSEDISRETSAFVASGGTLIVFPGNKIDIQSYNTFFSKIGANYITGIDSSKIFYNKINYNEAVFKDVFTKPEENPDMPFTTRHYKFSDVSDKNQTVLLTAENNDMMLGKTSFGSGMVYISAQAADAKFGNLVLHPVWAPMLYNMVFFGNKTDKLYYIIGKNTGIAVNTDSYADDEVVKISNPELKTDFIPLIRRSENGQGFVLFPEDNVRYAGNYSAEQNNKLIKGIAFNYNRTESEPACYDISEIQKMISEKGLKTFTSADFNENTTVSQILPYGKQTELWKFFLIAALIFLGFEVLLVRFMK